MRNSIRTQIIALTLTAIAISLLGYILFGTNLILEDKQSYIYDYTFVEAQSVADQLDAQIEQLRSSAWAAGELWEQKSPQSDGESGDSDTRIQQYYDTKIRPFSISSLIIAEPLKGSFKSLWATAGVSQPDFLNFIAKAGWSPAGLESSDFLISPNSEERLGIGFPTRSGQGERILVTLMMDMNSSLFGDRGKVFHLQLVDRTGRALLSSRNMGELSPQALTKCRELVLSSGFGSGARDCDVAGSRFIAAYQRVGKSDLAVIGLISREEAFRSASLLVWRSSILGIGILLIVGVLTYLFARRLTARLIELTLATEKVSAGDFSIRVSAGTSNDEIAKLSRSFNTMSSRITQLMVETAEKARMEKELETAQTLQTQFFQDRAFRKENLSFAGDTLPATECAGDWWHYFVAGEYFFVAIGDVTGHGVSSALVTAAAHGAFAVVRRRISENPPKDPDHALQEILLELNHAVYVAGKGQYTMTFALSAIHLRHGEVSFVTASHPPIFVFQKKDQEKNPLQSVKVLQTREVAALGQNAELGAKPARFQMESGDVMYLYTDGLTEALSEDGRTIRKSDFVRILADAAKKAEGSAESTQKLVLSEYTRFAGKKIESPEDDVTLLALIFLG